MLLKFVASSDDFSFHCDARQVMTLFLIVKTALNWSLTVIGCYDLIIDIGIHHLAAVSHSWLLLYFNHSLIISIIVFRLVQLHHAQVSVHDDRDWRVRVVYRLELIVLLLLILCRRRRRNLVRLVFCLFPLDFIVEIAGAVVIKFGLGLLLGRLCIILNVVERSVIFLGIFGRRRQVSVVRSHGRFTRSGHLLDHARETIFDFLLRLVYYSAHLLLLCQVCHGNSSYTVILLEWGAILGLGRLLSLFLWVFVRSNHKGRLIFIFLGSFGRFVVAAHFLSWYS